MAYTGYTAIFFPDNILYADEFYPEAGISKRQSRNPSEMIAAVAVRFRCLKRWTQNFARTLLRQHFLRICCIGSASRSLPDTREVWCGIFNSHNLSAAIIVT